MSTGAPYNAYTYGSFAYEHKSHHKFSSSGYVHIQAITQSGYLLINNETKIAALGSELKKKRVVSVQLLFCDHSLFSGKDKIPPDILS